MTRHRVVEPELLDHLPADDPAAMRSRRDLRRVHVAMGTRGRLRDAWQALVAPSADGAPLRVLELGAGDGTLLLGVARALAPRWPPVRLTLLDRQDLVGRATRDAYAALGWTVQVRVADVTAWATDSDAAGRWDLISTALFLHHFDGTALDRLLAAVAARADRFCAIEPARTGPALLGSRLVGLLGANAVTREDAVASVRAGFRGRELSARWPGDATRWRLREAPAGPFGHGFDARRLGDAR